MSEPIKLKEFKEATTGYRELDRDVNQAVDSVMISLKPILRDLIRRELKIHLQLEESDEQN